MHHAGRRVLVARRIEQPDQLAASGDLVAGQRQLADAAGEDAVPETTTVARALERAAHLHAEDLGETRQPADRRRQGALDLGANAPRQRRRRAAGRDGDGDGRAIDDRRHDEAGETAAGRRHSPAGSRCWAALRHARCQRLVVGGDDHQRHAGKIVVVEAAAGPRDARLGDQLGDLAHHACRRSG